MVAVLFKSVMLLCRCPLGQWWRYSSSPLCYCADALWHYISGPLCFCAGALWDNGGTAVYVDGHLFPTSVHWLLLWLSQTGEAVQSAVDMCLKFSYLHLCKLPKKEQGSFAI